MTQSPSDKVARLAARESVPEDAKDALEPQHQTKGQIKNRPKGRGKGPKAAKDTAFQRQVVIRPLARPARVKQRHWGLLFSFFLIVIAPVLLSAWYLWARAADQYASTLGFSVRTEDIGSALDFFGGISQLSSGSSLDTDVLYEFIQSQQMVARINQQLDLKSLYSKPLETDPILAFDPTGSIEDLTHYWARMVRIAYDAGTGLIELRILAFEAQDARTIAQAIFTESSAMINRLSAIAQADATRYAKEELDLAVERLKLARQAVTEFRITTQIVDPNAYIQVQMGLLNTLQQQLAESLIDLDLLSDSTNSGDPRIEQGNRKIKVIRARIAEERRKFGGGDGTETTTYAILVGEYERLIVDREFAEQAYISSLSAYDAAQAEAQRQSRYLAAYIEPTLAERAEYPQREMLLALLGLFLFLVWSILGLVYYSLRDRR